jgi:hypothetical protein
MDTTHNCLRRFILLPLSMLLANLSFINTYFTPSFFFFILYTTIVQSINASWINYVAEFTCLLYVVTLFVCIGGSLIGDMWTKYAGKATYIFTLFTFLLMGLVIWNVIGVYL